MKHLCNGKPQSPQMRSYHKSRATLFALLGHVCALCPATTDLEFDVKIPVGDPKSHHGKMSSTSRMAFYKRQHKAENLQVLCTKCNSSKCDRETVQMPLPEIPAEELAEYTR